jgi:hypothetical protein
MQNQREMLKSSKVFEWMKIITFYGISHHLAGYKFNDVSENLPPPSSLKTEAAGSSEVYVNTCGLTWPV